MAEGVWGRAHHRGGDQRRVAGNNSGIAPNWCCRISQIKGVIPFMQFWNAVGEFRSARSGVPADHLVRPTMDLLGARDPQLETAKGLIAAPR